SGGPGRPGGADEFGAFLADVTVTVGKAVEAWRARVTEAMLRWEGEGYRTQRLEALLTQEAPAAVDAAITEFAHDVERLKALESEVAQFDPEAAGHSVFRDPERMGEAEQAAARVREGGAPPLDDIHLIAGKERTQEELFNLFNLLQDQDRQLVFTAPTPPNTLVGLEERIASRLEGGLVAELTEPDRDVKRTVLERLLTLQGINAEPALIDYLADRHADSVRGLVAGVQRVVSAAAAQDAPVSAGLAREVLEGQAPRGARRSPGLRTSGLVVSSLGGTKSREKRSA